MIVKNSFLLLKTIYTKTHYTKRCMSKIGFIGIGNMGGHMARNLIKNGHNLSVYDTNTSVTQQLENEYKNQAKQCNNLKEVTENADFVITMLPDNEIVLKTYLNDDGIINNIQSNEASKVVLMDCSTVSPSVSETICEKAKEKGIKFIDAPVSGGVVGAKDKTLTFMVGGEKYILPLVENVLLGMGKSIFHCGKIGNGEIAKLCNNMLLGITMIGTAEVLNLGSRLGMDPKVLTDIINVSTGRCWSSEIYNPVPNILPNVPSSNNYQGGFSTKLIWKDLKLGQMAANSSDTSILLGSTALNLYSLMRDNSYGDKDFSSVYEYIQNKKK